MYVSKYVGFPFLRKDKHLTRRSLHLEILNIQALISRKKNAKYPRENIRLKFQPATRKAIFFSEEG